MAIELGPVAALQTKSVGRAAGPQGGKIDADTAGEGAGSFASALSASRAVPKEEAVLASASARATAKKPDASDRRDADDGVVSADSPAVGDAGTRASHGDGASDGGDSDGDDGAGRAGNGAATGDASAAPAGIAAGSDAAMPPQAPAATPLPPESALLLAQGALIAANVAAPVAADATAATNTTAIVAGVASSQRRPSAATAPTAEITSIARPALPAASPSASTAALSAALPSAKAQPAAITVAGQVSDNPAGAVDAAAAVSDAVPAVTNAVPRGAGRALAGTSGAGAAGAVATESVAGSAGSAGAAATSATATLAASTATFDPKQAQRSASVAAVAAQVQAQTQAADRAASTAQLDARAAGSPVAAGLASGASAEITSSSPLLSRFERVLSITGGAGGDAAAFGGASSGGALAASPWMTPVDGAGAGASASMGSTADRLAETMNGWLAQAVSQKNQQASLTVEVGGQPVSVNVQVQGNEAQVVFRTDQAETRAMLAQALPQLKQMMGAEGMLLSDASVAGQWAGGSGPSSGSSGSPGSDGSRGGDARREPLSARIDGGIAATSGAARAVPPPANGRRSLDLYV